MMLAARGAIRASGAGLPYDAEVEYLESSGMQYIETGIIPDANTGLQLFSSSPVNTNDAYIAGERNDSNNTRWVIGWSSAGTKWYCGYGATITSMVDGSPILTSINYLGDGLFKVGDSYSYTLPSLSYSPSYNIRLFGSAGVVATYTRAAVKIYSAKISVGNTLVRDFIPVRKKTVGYLYDRVSGKLFGNEGSGDFVLGSDVVVPATWVDGEYWDTFGVATALSGASRCDNFMPVQPSSSVTFYLGVRPGGTTLYMVQYNANKERVNSTYNSNGSARTVTIPANCYYIRVSANTTQKNEAYIHDDTNDRNLLRYGKVLVG